jgi:class 3 adenylate cyclase
MQATWRYRFPVSRERLWPFVSDTDRVNRVAGLPPVSYRLETGADGKPRTIATARRGPLRISWEEPPFVWEVPARLGVTRRFLGGPFETFVSDVTLTPDGDGTVLEHRVELVPRNVIGRMLAPLVVESGRRGAERAYAAASKEALAVGSHVEPTAAQAAEETALEKRFLAALERERALDGKIDMLRAPARALAAFLEMADDRDLTRIRPYSIADRLMADRRSLLALMLALTRGGLLDLSWDVVCGSCRRPQQFEKLDELHSGVHCPMCNITFGPEFDRNVEVTFSAAPLGRGVDVPVFCAVGPHANRQVYAQASVGAGESASFELSLMPGRYALSVAPERAINFDVEDTNDHSQIDAEFDAEAIRLSVTHVCPGRLRVMVKNATGDGALVKIVEAALPPDIATAADVTAIQEFRDLFSSEVLATGLELSIRSMTIVFSDLVGSTHLYSSHGDAPAFRIVSEHFDCLRRLISENRGAIVKTIGDAIMAVFVDPGDAFDAAIRFAPTVGVVQGPSGPLEIRVGMHSGPCIAMRANDRLDYFGTTVNLSARIGHIAEAGEVALSATMAELPAIAKRIGQREQRLEKIQFKGIAGPVGVIRMAADAR